MTSKPQNSELTQEQQFMIAQVEATMAISNMPLSENCRQNIKDIVLGNKTVDQIAEEITKKYTSAFGEIQDRSGL